MKKVLILEDNLYTAEDMCTEIRYKFQNYDIEIIVSNSIDEADQQLKNISDEELLCIVADLNMNPDGLSKDQKLQTEGAVLTGWIWVYTHILETGKFADKTIIFYSAFISRLQSNISFLNFTHSKKKRTKIKLMNKNEHNFNDLCNELSKIIKEG